MQWRGPDARRWRIALINGPNMKYLGGRDAATFGAIDSIAALEDLVAQFGEDLGVEVIALTSNSEPDIIDFIQTTDVDGVLINPAGLTVYGHSTRDALLDRGKPYVEVHFANLSQWYAQVSSHQSSSAFTHLASGFVMGLKHHGYLGGLLALVLSLDDPAFLGAHAEEGATNAS